MVSTLVVVEIWGRSSGRLSTIVFVAHLTTVLDANGPNSVLDMTTMAMAFNLHSLRTSKRRPVAQHAKGRVNLRGGLNHRHGVLIRPNIN